MSIFSPPKKFLDSRVKLVETIKKKKPTLNELAAMLKKKGFEKLEMEMFVFGWYVLPYVKPDEEPFNRANYKDNPLADIYNEYRLAETIKKRRPTLNELVIFLQQQGLDQEQMLKFVRLWDVLQYVKKDKQFMNMTNTFTPLKI